MYFFLKKKILPLLMDAVVQNQQMKQSNTFFTFFPYHYLKLGVVQMKSVFDLSFQESTYSMRHVSSSLKLTHLLLLVTAFYLPCCPWFVSRPGGWENCFFYLLLPQQPSSFSHCQTDAGVCVFLPFGQ